MKMKILVTGNAGAGKTTLSRRIGDAQNLPVFGLVKIVWKEGWKKTPPTEKQRRIAEIISQDDWVIDGVSTPALEAADIVVFIDVSRLESVKGCLKRNWRYLFSGRPELPNNCPEILIIPKQFKIIWYFYKHVRPTILQKIDERHRADYVITNRRDIETLPLINKGAQTPDVVQNRRPSLPAM